MQMYYMSAASVKSTPLALTDSGSKENLRQRILVFIDYINATMAIPFKWTYAGRPLTC
jgi:hypothetical protein